MKRPPNKSHKSFSNETERKTKGESKRKGIDKIKSEERIT